MKKTMGVLLAGLMVLTSAGAAVAADGRGQPSATQGSGAERMRRFQKETLSLRDELAAKRVDLEAEYDKAEPDPARIAALRNEIADLQGRIQAAADKHGVRRGHARGMSHGHDCVDCDWGQAGGSGNSSSRDHGHGCGDCW